LFIVRGLQPGGYDLRLLRYRPDGTAQVLYKQMVQVKEFPAPIEVTIPPFTPLPEPSPAMLGTVRDSGGKPVKLGRVMMLPEQSTFTDLEGHYDFERITDFRARRLWVWNAAQDQAAVV